MWPSSRFALSLKPSVEYLASNFCALWKKQTTLPSYARVLPCAAASAGSLGGDRRGFLLESQLSIPIKRVRVVVAASTLAALTVFACQKDYLSEPRNHETRNGVPAMVSGWPE